MEKDIIYENSPLDQVIFQINFPGEPKVECQRDLFFEEVRVDYPNLLVPHYKTEEFPAFAPYRFESFDRNSGITVALNQIGVYCRNYRSFREFKAETLRIITIFKCLYNLSDINRIGLRYVNVLPFIKGENFVAYKKFFDLKFKLPKCITDDFNSLNFEFGINIGKGNLNTTIKNVLNSKNNEEAFILDFDYSLSNNSELELSFDHIETYLEESHQYTKQFFENIISKEYKAIMKGEYI